MKAAYAFSVFLSLFLNRVFTPQAHAFEMDDVPGYIDITADHSETDSGGGTVQDGRRFRKFQVALQALGVPPETDPDFSKFPAPIEVSESDVMDHLPYIDPDGGLHRYLNLQANSIGLYKDFFSSLLPRDYLEFEQEMRDDNPSSDSLNLMNRLNQVATQVKAGSELPLSGLRIIIDPGHMGPAEVMDVASGKMSNWDEITGKYVKYKGGKVSEGLLNLWTAMLTARQLESLGAEVRLTRSESGTVSKEDPTHFDITPYRNQYFYNSLDSWMNNYLHLSDAELARQVVKAPQVTAMKDPGRQVQQFYIGGADLEARSKMIDEFNPDITIDIHYDASKVNALQNGMDDVEAYVPGGFRETETGSRNIRAMELKHLLEGRRWNASVDLASAVTSSMAHDLNLPLLDRPSFLTAVKVKDGVYARNLYITRRAVEGLMVYLECLHYDHVNEFQKLTRLTELGQYHGVSFQYPSRLNQVSNGIMTGILNYFRSL